MLKLKLFWWKYPVCQVDKCCLRKCPSIYLTQETSRSVKKCGCVSLSIYRLPNTSQRGCVSISKYLSGYLTLPRVPHTWMCHSDGSPIYLHISNTNGDLSRQQVFNCDLDYLRVWGQIHPRFPSCFFSADMKHFWRFCFNWNCYFEMLVCISITCSMF